MENTFRKVRSVRDIVISAAVTAAGIALLFIGPVSWLGWILLIAGLVMVFTYKTSWRQDGDKTDYKHVVYYFPPSDRSKIAACLEGDVRSITIPADQNESGDRMDVYYNRDERKLYAQLLEFVPYTYKPVTGLVKLQLPEASNLLP